MGRSRADLREISVKLQAHINNEYPGLACLGFLFDAKQTGAVPVNIMLHGINLGQAIKFLEGQIQTLREYAGLDPDRKEVNDAAPKSLIIHPFGQG